MVAVLSSFSLFTLLLGAVVLAPLLSSLLERSRQRELDLRRQLLQRDEVIRACETTLDVYREVVAGQMGELEPVRMPTSTRGRAVAPVHVVQSARA